MAIPKTPRFADSIAGARGTMQSQNDVFAVFRINGDEDSIGVVVSESFSATDPTAGILALSGGLELTTYNLKKSTKRKPADVIAENAIAPQGKIATVNASQEGGHAEENFLRILPALGRNYGHLTTVELYLSRIPCIDQSPHWLYTIGSGPIQPYNQLPAGCGPKLYKIIRDEIPCRWEIEWEEDYPNPTTQARCAQQMQLIDQLPNARAGKVGS